MLWPGLLLCLLVGTHQPPRRAPRGPAGRQNAFLPGPCVFCPPYCLIALCLPLASVVAHLDVRLARGKLQACWCTIALPFFTGRGIPVKHVYRGWRAVRSAARAAAVGLWAAVVDALDALDPWPRFVAPPARRRPLSMSGRQFAAGAWLLHFVCHGLAMFLRGHGLLLLLYWHHSLAVHVWPLVAHAAWPALCLVAFFMHLPGACLTNSLRACPRWLSSATRTVYYHCSERPQRLVAMVVVVVVQDVVPAVLLHAHQCLGLAVTACCNLRLSVYRCCSAAWDMTDEALARVAILVLQSWPIVAENDLACILFVWPQFVMPVHGAWLAWLTTAVAMLRTWCSPSCAFTTLLCFLILLDLFRRGVPVNRPGWQGHVSSVLNWLVDHVVDIAVDCLARVPRWTLDNGTCVAQETAVPFESLISCLLCSSFADHRVARRGGTCLLRMAGVAHFPMAAHPV